MAKFTPPVVVRGSRIAEIVDANLRFFASECQTPGTHRGSSKSEDSSLRRVHAGIISGPILANTTELDRVATAGVCRIAAVRRVTDDKRSFSSPGSRIARLLNADRQQQGY
jgi:hypothetical protein